VNSLVTQATRLGWTTDARRLFPGAHVVLLADTADAAVEGRLLGLELRDAILVLRPGPVAGFAFLFRVPVAESTVIGQVLSTGTGAINVDGCRVKHANPADLEKHQAMVAAIKARGGSMENSWKNSSDLAGANDVKMGGRWPPNILLVHSPGCRKVGSKQVESGVAVRRNVGKSGGHFGFGGANPDMRDDVSYAGEDGNETVTSWECELGCPVPMIDAMSGDHQTSKPGEVYRRKDHETTSMAGSLGAPRGVPEVAYGDSGGASRFFPQFVDEAEMLAWIHHLVTPV
jgi:hypothetical protein